MRPAVALHAGAAVLWIGALLPLGRSLARGERVPLVMFSRAIPPVVALLLATGAVLASVQIGRWDALWTTAYGRVLLAKLALVAVLLAIAALNRRALAPGAAKGRPAPLQRAVGARGHPVFLEVFD